MPCLSYLVGSATIFDGERDTQNPFSKHRMTSIGFYINLHTRADVKDALRHTVQSWQERANALEAYGVSYFQLIDALELPQSLKIEVLKIFTRLLNYFLF